MAGAAVSIDSRDLRDFRKHLRGLGKEWPKELRSIHREIAEDVSSKARTEARSSAPSPQSHFADALKGYSTQRAASVGLRGRKSPANAAFWGAKKNTGWNRRARDGSKPQHPEWVGASWRAGVRGEGPYAINDTIATETDRIVDSYGRMVDDLARAAGFH